MADDIVQLAPDGTGKKADMSSLTVGANTVYRQRMNLADPTVAAALALVMNSAPAGTEYGLVVRQAGPIGALAAGSAIIGKVTTDQTTHGTSDLVAADLMGKALTINSSLTRPANTTAYTANQVISASTTVGTYQTFANAARVAAGSGMIVGVNLLDEVNATTPLAPVLFLFNAAPASALNDGAALTLSNADGILLIAAIPLVSSYLLNASASPNGARLYTAQGLNIAYKLASGTSLYGVLMANAAYTPVSGEVLVTQLQVLQD